MSGGGGGGPTSSTVTQTNIPDWLRPQVEATIGAGMQEMFQTQKGEDGNLQITGMKPFTPYSSDPRNYVAGFSPLQQQAFGNVANLQVPGQFGAASQFANQAGLGGLGAAQQAGGYGGAGYGFGAQAAGLAPAAQFYGQGAANIGSQAAGLAPAAQFYGQGAANIGAQATGMAPAAQAYGQGAANIGMQGLGAQRTGANVGRAAMGLASQQAGAEERYTRSATDPYSVQSFMSPYMQNVVDVQQQQAQRQSDIARQADQAKFAQSGAFGGGRGAIAGAQANADLMRAKQGIQAQGLQNAFQQAQQAQQFGANLGLQGLAGAQQGLGNVLQGGQLGLVLIALLLVSKRGFKDLGKLGSFWGWVSKGNRGHCKDSDRLAICTVLGFRVSKVHCKVLVKPEVCTALVCRGQKRVSVEQALHCKVMTSPVVKARI
jgi:hypothetical protein